MKIREYVLKFYLGGIELPITSFSIKAEPSGYYFSVDLPPSDSTAAIPLGGYGYVTMHGPDIIGGLVADGVLVSDTPSISGGFISRQLVFSSVDNLLNYVYLTPKVAASLDKLQDVSCKEELPIYSVPNPIKGSRKNPISASFGEAFATVVNHVQTKCKGGRSTSVLNASGVLNILSNINTKPSSYPKRYLVGMNDYTVSKIKGSANMGAIASAYLMVSTGGVSAFVPHRKYRATVLSIYAMEEICIPGRINGQYFIIPKMGTNFIPNVNMISKKIDAIQLFPRSVVSPTHHIEVLPYNPNNTDPTSAFMSSLAKFNIKSTMPRLYVSTNNTILNLVKKIQLKKAAENQGTMETSDIKKMLDNIAKINMLDEVFQNAGITVVSSHPYVDVIPGAGVLLSSGTIQYVGKVMSVSVDMSSDAIQSQINVSHVRPIGVDTSFWLDTSLVPSSIRKKVSKIPKSILDTIGLFESSSVISSIKKIKRSIDYRRRDNTGDSSMIDSETKAAAADIKNAIAKFKIR